MTALDIAKKIAKAIAKPFEGWSAVVYLCPAGFPTIAWGHRTTMDHPPVTKEEGGVILDADMATALSGALRYCPVLVASPEKWGAIADFCFNLGVGRLQTSTLRRRINQGNWPEAVKELRRWMRGGGRILPGLVARREAEILAGKMG
ncbi:MAG: lysozyme [Desulfobacteraceae bacterium]|nr:lysozyme [Desulfobacteraceae bacterium]